LAARENGPTHKALALSLSHANACNPLLQAHPTWAQGNTKAVGFPFACFFPPSCSISRRPIWAGTRGDNLLVGPGTPRVETPTGMDRARVQGYTYPDRRLVGCDRAAPSDRAVPVPALMDRPAGPSTTHFVLCLTCIIDVLCSSALCVSTSTEATPPFCPLQFRWCLAPCTN
jgi:hypothetical protein